MENNYKPLTKEELEKAFSYCLEKIDEKLEEYDGKYPTYGINNKYRLVETGDDWVEGFWVGMLWLAYEMTNDEKYRVKAEKYVLDMYKRIDEKINVAHHDMGFLYSLSCVAAYKLTGNEIAKKAAIMAADNLLTRYQQKGEFIQAWGELGAEKNYRLIIDCLLNIPLLFWATQVTGDKKYEEVAKKHFKTSMKVSIRENGSTNHTYYFDPKTGEPLRGETAQGANNDSSWARGQAWGIYGIPLGLKYAYDEKYIDTYYKVFNHFIENLPSDYVCGWDLIFTQDDCQRDSSAAATAVCGMKEMLKYSKRDEEKINMAINNILRSLIENYTTKNTDNDGLLMHGVYSLPIDLAVDECVIWGDYFYMEALVRMLKDWELYW